MRIKLKLDVAPLAGIKAMAEEAGLVPQPSRRTGKTGVRKWKTDAPGATARFASLGSTHQLTHPLAWGGAKLTGSTPKRSKARAV